MCKGWFQRTLSEVGSVLRVCSSIWHCNYVPTAISKFRNERKPIVPQAILAGEHYALSPAMVLSLSGPPTSPPFFFSVERSPQEGSTTRETERVFFFFGGCGEGVMEDVTYHSTKLSEGLTKKKSGERCLCTTGSLWADLMLQCEFQGEHSFLPWSRTHSLVAPKKKKRREGLHTRATNATPPLRRLRPCQLLLPCGALPADRDGLRTAVSACGRFFA